MLPLFFGPDDRPLFGAFHAPEAPGLDTVVVLCPPFGHEALHAHRALRHLAEALARAGIAAFRVDYDGTGNAAGSDLDEDRVAAWERSIALAAAEARARSGKPRLVLMGLRWGALLALRAARGVEADAVALWSPVPSGRTHARELVRLHKMLVAKPPSDRAPESVQRPALADADEVLGFVLQKETGKGMGTLDVASLTEAPASACLVVGAGDGGEENGPAPGDAKMVEHLRSLGAEVTFRAVTGHTFLVDDPHKNVVPEDMIAATVAFVTGRAKAEETRPVAAPTGPVSSGRVGTGVREEAWQMGPHKIFGVLSRPETIPAARTCVLLLNAGSIHHVGPNRLHVAWARQWALSGAPVLRMDLSGIGESPFRQGATENVPYPPSAVHDVLAAMDALESGGVADRFVILGLCSGADIAFRVALSDTRPGRVAAAVLLNPQAFHFPSSDALKAFMATEIQARYYQGGLRDMDRWKKVLRGEVDVRRVAGIFLGKVKNEVARRVARLAQPNKGEGAAQGIAPESIDIIEDFRTIGAKGTRTLLLCSEDDPGLQYLEAYFGGELPTLDRVPGFRRELFKGTDHTFTPVWSQQALTATLTAFLEPLLR